MLSRGLSHRSLKNGTIRDVTFSTCVPATGISILRKFSSNDENDATKRVDDRDRFARSTAPPQSRWSPRRFTKERFDQLYIPPRSEECTTLSALSSDISSEELPFEMKEELRVERRDRERGKRPDAEYWMRIADYMTAQTGSTEERVLHRRILSEAFDDPKDGEEFLAQVDKLIEEEEMEELMIGKDDIEAPSQLEKELNPEKYGDGSDADFEPDPNRLSEIPVSQMERDWHEMIVQNDRVQKVQKGGTMLRYRSLVVGGNGRGVGGFGIGKASEPKLAVEIASRKCKRNIFFVDPYMGSGLTTDLVGKHNSCIVRLFAQPPNRGLKGHPLIQDILLYMGITDCTAKSHGNRNKYNIVYATFKALMQHRSLEDVARARGKRFITLERAKRAALN